MRFERNDCDIAVGETNIFDAIMFLDIPTFDRLVAEHYNDVRKGDLMTPVMITCLRHIMSQSLGPAVEYTLDKMYRRLIECGADVNARNAFGETPLHIAIQNNRWSLAESLILSGADPDAVDNKGINPFGESDKDRLDLSEFTDMQISMNGILRLKKLANDMKQYRESSSPADEPLAEW